jgi:diguanylate cyclase (GGDEF)-like protein
MDNLNDYKKYIKEQLASFYQIFAKASVGDYSEDVVIPQEGDELAELAAGIQVMLEVIRSRISELEAEIADRTLVEEKIRYQAAHDPITGLPNRHSFDAALSEAILTSGEKKMALLYFDIDRFKQVNDAYGHQTGDLLLKEFATRVHQCIRQNDIIARLGGDEFAVVLRDIKTTQDATRVVKKIVKALEPPISLDERTVFLSASIGIAMFPHDGRDLWSFVANADVALLHAKQSGRNHYKFYRPSMGREVSSQLGMVQELRQALRENQIELYYQPIIDTQTQKTLSIEALLRWQHPKRGLLTAGEFITVAEHYGIMRMLGEETLRAVLAQQGSWQEHGTHPIRVAVNISPREFTDSRFVERIKKLLAEYRIQPSLLEFEIVETLAMENIELAKDRFKALRKLGITISIDDFGTGYSSLSYLKDLPIDNLKIDKSFVRRSITSEQDRAIIQAIVTLGHSLHLRVVAEGVETEEQLHLLRDLGCDAVQGFYTGRPMPPAKLVEWASQFEPIL